MRYIRNRATGRETVGVNMGDRWSRRRCLRIIGGVAIAPTLLRATRAKAAGRSPVKVDGELPFVVNANNLTADGVKVKDNGILRGQTRVRKPGKGLRPRKKLAVDRWYANPAAKIVQVTLVDGDVRKGLLQAIYDAGQNVDQTPYLLDAKGRKFMAVGWIVANQGDFRFSIDHGKPIRELGDTDPGRVSNGQTFKLVYQIPKGMTLAAFRCGSYTLKLPPTPVK